MGTNSSVSLPWSTDMWDHPSIKPYEEAREYPKESVFSDNLPREESRDYYEAIEKGPNRGKQSLSKGKVLYDTYCYACHGMEGKGDGSMADLMDNAPRNLTCKNYMNKITDGELFWVIKEGVVEGGMPSYKHLSDKKIWQLIQYIRTFSS